MFIYFMHTMPDTASCSPRPLHHCSTQISTTYMHSNKMHHGAFRQDILRHVISYELSSVQSTSLCVPVRMCVRLCICVFVSNGLIAYVWTTGGKTACCLYIVCEWPTRKASSLQQPQWKTLCHLHTLRPWVQFDPKGSWPLTLVSTWLLRRKNLWVECTLVSSEHLAKWMSAKYIYKNSVTYNQRNAESNLHIMLHTSSIWNSEMPSSLLAQFVPAAFSLLPRPSFFVSNLTHTFAILALSLSMQPSSHTFAAAFQLLTI